MVLEEYIPENLRNLPLFQCLCQGIRTQDGSVWQGALQKIIDEKYVATNELKQKWWGSVDNIDEYKLRAIITELGYDYLLDILSLSDDELLTIFNFLGLIHYLKGSKKGLELVFTLIGLDFEVVEWWETIPKGTACTFTLSFTCPSDKFLTTTLDALKTFCRQYVYPLMTYEAKLSGTCITVTGGLGVPEYIFTCSVTQNYSIILDPTVMGIQITRNISLDRPNALL